MPLKPVEGILLDVVNFRKYSLHDHRYDWRVAKLMASWQRHMQIQMGRRNFNGTRFRFVYLTSGSSYVADALRRKFMEAPPPFSYPY